MDVIELAIPKGLQDQVLPDPYDLNYYQDREQRIFYIEEEIDYNTLEIAKIIFRLNYEERHIPKEYLKPIYIIVFSCGGDLNVSNAVVDSIISSRIPIITINLGIAMSGGGLIFLAGHKRYGYRHSQLLIHSGSGVIGGTASEIEEAQKNYKQEIENMKSYILSRTAIDEKTFNKNMSKDWYIRGDDLIKYKVIDGFIDNVETIWANYI